MSVGAVGGAGSVGASGAVSGGSSVGGASGAAAAGDSQSVGSAGSAGESGENSVQESSDPNKHAYIQPLDGCGNSMSTQNFITMQNNSIQQVNQCQEPEMDLEKLIEMMIAIKLLQEMNKNG